MKEVERLIDGFVPEAYILELMIDKKARLLTGEVRIEGEARAETIKLHAKKLKIEKIVVEESGKSREVKYSHSEDLVTIDGMKRGRVGLVISYSLKLNEQMHGVYLSRHRYEGKDELIVTTQFESHHARECLPCVDEPEAKATFDLSIVTPDDGDVVISNMPVAENKVFDDGRLCTKFEVTPRMSTYLLAFVVGKFNKASLRSEHGIEVNAYASLAQPAENLEFAVKSAAKVLDFFEDYFGVKYPLPKCDQVALPDFESGAMENWGLVTYRESCMLVDPKLTTIDDKSYVLIVIAHELSHQWFGNLVTMKWWDDLWLNESFASVMEYVAADAVEPELKVWKKFLTGDAVGAMRRDCLSGVQAVKQPVRHPNEIATLFDGAIVYAKGARLMYMLMDLMGEEDFRRGLRGYFEKFAYRNAEE